jgi:hypothetical protein
MNQRDYDKLMKQAAEELDEGIQLLRAAHDAKSKAIELLQLMSSGGSAALQGGRPRTSARAAILGKTEQIILSLVSDLPERFTGPDVDRELNEHQIPMSRGSRIRALARLSELGEAIEIETPGSGQRATIYRKKGGST